MASNTETAKVDVLINGQQANASLKEMQANARALWAEMRKISDPLNSPEFAKGKKALDDLNQKIAETTGKVKQSQSSWEKMLEVAGGMGMWELAKKGMGMVVQGFEWVKTVMESTEGGADKLKETFTAVQWGYDALMRSIANGDWSNLFKNIEQAVTAGAEFAKMLDDLDKKRASFKMHESDIDLKIINLREKQRDINLSDLDRAKVGLDIIGLLNEKMAGNYKLSKEDYGLTMKKAETESHLTKAQIEGYARRLWNNESLINESRKYLELQKELSDAEKLDSRDKTKIEKISNIRSEMEKTSSVAKAYSGVVKSMEDSSSTILPEIIDKYVAVNQAQINVKQEGRKAVTSFNSDIKSMLDENKKGMDEEGKTSKKHSDYLIQIQQDLYKTLAALQTNEKDRELKMLELDFKEKMSKVKGNSETEIKLKTAYADLYEKQKKEIENKYNDKDLAETITGQKTKWETILKSEEEWSYTWYQEKLKMLDELEALELQKTDLTEKEKLAIREKYAGIRVETSTQFQDKTYSFTPGDTPWGGDKGMAERSDMAGISDTNYSARLEALKTERDKELEIAGESVEAQKKIWNDYHDSVNKVWADIANTAISAFSTIVSSWSDLNQAINSYENAQLEKDQEVNDKKKENLKKQLDSKVISQKQYDEKVGKLDAEMDQKKKALTVEQAKRQKALSLAQAIINVAQGVTSALTAGPILGIVLAALVGLLGAIQIGYIASTPIPEAAKGRYKATSQAAGGRYNVIGQDDGQLYKDVPYQDSLTGIPGKPMLVNETGNEIVVDPATTKNIQVNYPWILSAINHARVPQYAEGAYPSPIMNNGKNTQVIASDPFLVQAITDLKDQLKNGTMAKIVYDEFETTKGKIEQIKSDVTK